MKLLFDLVATQSAILGPGGGGEYSRAVFRRLVERVPGQNLAGFLHPDFPLDKEVEQLVTQYEIEVIPAGDLVALQNLLDSGRFASFMSGLPYNYHVLRFGQMEVFLAMHGLRPLECPMPLEGRHYAQGLRAKLKWLAKYSLERIRPQWRRDNFQSLASVPCGRLHIIVPSRHTRYSLVEKLELGEGLQIHDFFCPETAVCQIEKPDPAVLGRLGVQPGKYLFMVSGHRWIKNAHRTLKAAIEVMDKMPDDRWLPIVMTGRPPGGLPRGRRPYIIPAGRLNLEDLSALYAGARAFVYPTLNEGFGYPPLEAMAQETPIVCSAISSVTEVVGEAGFYFCPTNTDELKIRLRMALEDDALLDELRERGKVRFAEVRQRQHGDLEKLCDLLLASVKRP